MDAKFKSVVGKQRFHRSSNIGIIRKQLRNGDSVSFCPGEQALLILKVVGERVWN